jgi:hypothetical protein
MRHLFCLKSVEQNYRDPFGNVLDSIKGGCYPKIRDPYPLHQITVAGLMSSIWKQVGHASVWIRKNYKQSGFLAGLAHEARP